MTASPADHRLRFGAFFAPFHPPGQSPTLALEYDLERAEALDRFGFDEVWFGEHHSGGYELIPSPEVFIAAAAERTKHIELGTGVTSLPYHHPLIVADRMVLLDHLTRGRVIFGTGPGALPTDAYMMGIDPVDQRRMMEESLEAILALYRSDEPVTRETDWFSLRDFADYFGGGAGFVPLANEVTEGTTSERDYVEAYVEGGGGNVVIGTPDDAIAYIEGLLEQSGGFGTFLLLGHDWARPERTIESYRLFAREVMPHFQGQLAAPYQSHEWATGKRNELFGRAGLAIMNAVQSHVEEQAGENG